MYENMNTQKTSFSYELINEGDVIISSSIAAFYN